MGRTSVALKARQATDSLRIKRLDPGSAQAEALIPLIGELMAEAAMAFSSLDRVAVCVGPGSFSGIRTGVAAARGIGLAAQIPVVGATSFRIMAETFEEMNGTAQCYGLVVSAGQNTVYCQIISRPCAAQTPIVALPKTEIETFCAGRAEVLAGPAAVAEAGLIAMPGLWPDAAPLTRIAMQLDPERDLPLPYYVRPADTRSQDKHRIPREHE